MDSANLHDGAQLLNSPDQPLPHRNHSSENAVLGHRLGSPIKGDPEPSLEHAPPLHSTNALPGHWEDLEAASPPGSGHPAPPRPPSRFTSVRPSPAPKLRQLSPLATRGLTPASIPCLQPSPATSIHARTAVGRSRGPPSTWCFPVTTTTTNRRGMAP